MDDRAIRGAADSSRVADTRARRRYDPERRHDADIDPNATPATIRSLFSTGGPRSSEQALRKVATALGHQRLDSRIRETVNAGLKEAVRRGILDDADGAYTLLCRQIDEYTRDHLVETLVAAMESGWQSRSDAITAAARRLGYRRCGRRIEAAFKSAINAALRRDLIEKRGPTLIRRVR